MTPQDLLSEIQGVRANVIDFPASVFLKFLFKTMAERVHDFRLSHDRRLIDAGDFKEFFEACAQAANGSRPHLTCPLCGHEHEGRCGVSMGGAGECGCTAEVRV